MPRLLRAVALLLATEVGLAEAGAEDASWIGVPPWLARPKGPEATLAPPEEPGGRFVMQGRLLGPGGKTGMPNMKMFVYHADHAGQYAKDNRHFMRLAGVLSTDSQGRYQVVSVLPGGYGFAPHVHFEAWGPGRGLRAWSVDLYRGIFAREDSSWNGMKVRHPGDPGQFHADVIRDWHGNFRAQYDLLWDDGFRAPAHLDSMRRGLVVP
jgi:hypothetical protein